MSQYFSKFSYLPFISDDEIISTIRGEKELYSPLDFSLVFQLPLVLLKFCLAMPQQTLSLFLQSSAFNVAG